MALPVAAQNSSPVAADIPEEVLRSEIYTEARSPVDGRLLSASAYAELQETLTSLENLPPEGFVSDEIRELVGLLRLRQFLRRFVPFVP
ncbi:MAG: hypothetical protein HC919_07135 [Oscillatoriales cyanobacterium SM2_2_1]|nr:hypothetical protein [Oscillatoriales cyanobacterium SM2_2_1]